MDKFEVIKDELGVYLRPRKGASLSHKKRQRIVAESWRGYTKDATKMVSLSYLGTDDFISLIRKHARDKETYRLIMFPISLANLDSKASLPGMTIWTTADQDIITQYTFMKKF